MKFFWQYQIGWDTKYHLVLSRVILSLPVVYTHFVPSHLPGISLSKLFVCVDISSRNRPFKQPGQILGFVISHWISFKFQKWNGRNDTQCPWLFFFFFFWTFVFFVFNNQAQPEIDVPLTTRRCRVTNAHCQDDELIKPKSVAMPTSGVCEDETVVSSPPHVPSDIRYTERRRRNKKKKRSICRCASGNVPKSWLQLVRPLMENDPAFKLQKARGVGYLMSKCCNIFFSSSPIRILWNVPFRSSSLAFRFTTRSFFVFPFKTELEIRETKRGQSEKWRKQSLASMVRDRRGGVSFVLHIVEREWEIFTVCLL